MNLTLQRNLSPINLVRSLSASVSGTSFGKLLLEDQHVVTGAHIQRKHEVAEKLTMKVKKHRRDKFNLKERVSSLKYNLGLRARLFGRMMHSASEFRDNDRSFMKDIMNGPTVMIDFDNATEVPPSLASVCSSIHEDFYRAEYCASPTTPSALTSDDNDLHQAFQDISSNLSAGRPSCGNTLLDQVWDMLHAYLHPNEDSLFYLFDMMVARDLHSLPWSELVNDDVDTLAKEVECQVLRDLITEMVRDMRDDYRRVTLANETLPDFKERWTEEISYIQGVPKVMQISTFMSNSKCPELVRRISDQVPKTVTKMMRWVDDFVKSEEAYKITELSRGEYPERRQGASYRGNTPPRATYRGQQRTDNYNNFHNYRDQYQPYVSHKGNN
ncbi:hypothetical protein Tco_0079176 [Tanacetum coccineum]